MAPKNRPTIALTLIMACTSSVREEEAAPSETMGPPRGTGSSTSTTEPAGAETSTGSSTGAAGESDATGSWDEGDGSSSSGNPGEDVDWPVVPCANDNEDPWLLGLVDGDTVLQRYRPAEGTFDPPVTLTCLDGPAAPGRVSLAIARDGRAYVSGLQPDTLISFRALDDDPCGSLQRVAWTAPSSDVALAFRSNDLFEPDTERLFVYGSTEDASGWLGEVYPFVEGSPVAVLDPATTPWSELAGTGDGRLFAVATSGDLISITGETFNGEAVSSALDLRGTDFFAWEAGVYVIAPLAGMQKVPTGGDLVRLELDGSEASAVVTPAAQIPLDVLSMATSTCAPVLGDR